MLLSAVELGVFTELGGAAHARELGAALGSIRAADPTSSTRWSRSASSSARGRRARVYRNTALTDHFLDRAKPSYVGGILEMPEARLYRFWGDLTEALRTGKPQNEIKHTGASMFANAVQRSRAARAVHERDAAASRCRNFEALAENFDFSRYKTLCDIGGANALLSRIVAARHPHLRCT